jgi:multiple sugar transport system substrate-binding protein
MFAKVKKIVLVTVLALSLGLPALAQKTVSITCRCVEGGVNSNLVQWLREYVIPEFERMMADEGNPVTVELIESGSSEQDDKARLALDLSVGAGADIMGFDGFAIPEFVAAGYLRPLDEIVGEEVNDWEGWSHIPEGLQALMGLDGERYGIAFGTDFRVIWYRKDMLEEAGVDNADAWRPQSWEEVLEAARMVKEAFPDSVPLQLNAGTAMGEATTMQGYWMALLGTGEGMMTEDGNWIVRSPGILDTLNLYKTIYVDENLGDARIQLLQDGRNQSFANFRDGRTAMLVEGDFFYRSVNAPGAEFAVENRDEMMGWAPMPAQQPGAGLRGQDVVTISGGTGSILNPNSQHPEEAWALLSFMNSREALEAAQQIEPRARIRDDVPIPDDVVLTETAAMLRPLTTSRPLSPAYAQISYEAQLMTERVVSGEMTPEEAMGAYAEAVTEIVGEENVVDLMQ